MTNNDTGKIIIFSGEIADSRGIWMRRTKLNYCQTLSCFQIFIAVLCERIMRSRITCER